MNLQLNMAIIKKYLVACFILSVVLLPDCEKDKKSECNGSFCTDEFRIVTILIKHASDSSAVVLTDYKVIRIADNKDVTRSEDFIPRNRGYYPLVSDMDINYLKNNSVEIEFQGYIDNTMVIKKRFIVAGDCCHVYLASGDSAFYI
jgi:hypothetical protein